MRMEYRIGVRGRTDRVRLSKWGTTENEIEQIKAYFIPWSHFTTSGGEVGLPSQLPHSFGLFVVGGEVSAPLPTPHSGKSSANSAKVISLFVGLQAFQEVVRIG